MTRPLTLIQLVSEQTMQNLLPVLRLKPSRLVHLATPRTASRSALVVEAARQSGCAVELETVRLSAMPSMRESHDAVLAAIEREGAAGHETILNFTGGTKLMSIGGYVAASQHRVPSLYVDTQDSMFVDGQTGDGLAGLLGGDLSFTPILRSLTVHAVAKANGCPRVTNGRDWRPFLPLARRLFDQPAECEQVHDAMTGLLGRGPRSPQEWLALLDKSFDLPDEVARLAVEAGLLPPAASDLCRLPDATREELQTLADARSSKTFLHDFDRRRIAATDAAQFPVNFLTGGWWEVVVAGKAAQSGRFRDLRWSVNIGERGGAELEEDIVALDGVQVIYISCKRGGHRAGLLPLLSEIKSRGQALGGSFTRCFLAVYHKPSGRVLANIRGRADELCIKLIFPEHLELADPFG